MKNRKENDKFSSSKVRDLGSLNKIFLHIFPKRTEAEVYVNQGIDITNLIKFIKKKNVEHPNCKTTLFHCFIAIIFRMLNERPLMNRYVTGRTMYQRNSISVGFVCKQKLCDSSEEKVITLCANGNTTLDSISTTIIEKTQGIRNNKKTGKDLNSFIDKIAKLPRFMLMAICRIIKWLEFWNLVPRALKSGDPDFCSVLISNLGSIKGPCVYHHLNNYGTNSIVVTLGYASKNELIMEDGSKEIRDILDIGVTLDERIADGFYFVKSLKLVQYLCDNPEILDIPLGEPSNFKY
ncbi:MAG: 2-oxo acid dehydrogenase subunit E2 [Enterococcus sp.]|nr:2-oxo acid dehydrogenase subunit E2 [Enterococcus sp.]